jgi:Tfp pilus assembly protein PilF
MSKAETARSMGDLAAAKRELEAALTALPSYAPAAAALAEVHMKQRSYQSARRYAKRASRSAPRKLAYMLLLGDAHYLAGDHKAAKYVWRKAAAYGSPKAKSRLAS